MSKPRLVFSERPAPPSSVARLAPSYPAGQSRETSPLNSIGFSGTCENTSLTDWIQLVQMGRRDAVMTVRAHDGKMGRLWCRDGDIVDASCDGLVGIEAVYRVLSWQGGTVAVDFRTFERPRQIPIATSALLLEAAYRSDSHVRALGSAPIAAIAQDLPRGNAVQSWFPAPELVEPKKRRKPRSKTLVLAGGFSGFVLLAALLSATVSHFGLSLGHEKAPPRIASAEFLVQVEVAPVYAEIALDGTVVAVGQLNQTLPRDGRTHELRFSAPGYLAAELVFRDTPPERRVILTPSDEAPLRDTGMVATAIRDLPSRTAPPGANAVTAAARPARAQLKHAHPVVAKRPEEQTLAKVDAPASEERRPRIQVIEDQTPRIEEVK